MAKTPLIYTHIGNRTTIAISAFVRQYAYYLGVQLAVACFIELFLCVCEHRFYTSKLSSNLIPEFLNLRHTMLA
jgi:hypothetical protein